MAISRYRNVNIIRNGADEYNEIFKKRGVNYIDQYTFEKFQEMKLKDIPTLNLDSHIWTSSDRFYKIATQYYGNPTYWWVIALFNNVILESDVRLGQRLLIPIPIETIISALKI
jgi:hypothetical protein